MYRVVFEQLNEFVGIIDIIKYRILHEFVILHIIT